MIHQECSIACLQMQVENKKILNREFKIFN